MGPPPVQAGGPELLIGANSPAATRRVGRWADGLLVPGTPDSVSQAYNLAEESWKAEGRPGAPRLVGAAYYALGPEASGSGAAYIRDYYAFMAPADEYMVQAMLTTPQAIKDTIDGFPP